MPLKIVLDETKGIDMADDDVPENVRLAFADRTLLSVPEVVALLGIDAKTLRKHIANGDLPGRIKGTGTVRRHWVFTIADVAKFLAPKPPARASFLEIDHRIPKLPRRTPMVRGPTMNINLRIRRKGSVVKA